MKTISVNINNMTCHACEKVVTKRLSAINGVQGIKVEVQNGKAVLTAANSISKEEIETALAGTHYQVVSVE